MKRSSHSDANSKLSKKTLFSNQANRAQGAKPNNSKWIVGTRKVGK